MSPLARSYAFIGVEQYRKSLTTTLNVAISENNRKRKGEESSESKMHRMPKKQKTSKEAATPSKPANNLQKNQCSSKEKSKKKIAATKSGKRHHENFLNVRIKTNYSFKMASKTVISLPSNKMTYDVAVHVKGNCSATIDCRRKREASPISRTDESRKRQKTTNVYSKLENSNNQRVEYSLKMNCKSKNAPKTTEKMKRKDSKKLNRKSAASLVKSDAFIGEDQYREQLKTMNGEAVHVRQSSKERNPTSSATKTSANRLVKSNAFVGMEQYLERLKTIVDEATKFNKKRNSTSSPTMIEKPLAKSNAFIGVEQYLEQIKAINDEAMQASEKSNTTSCASKTIANRLVKSIAFIGVEQYLERIKTISDEDSSVDEKRNPTATKTGQKPLAKSNAFIGERQYLQQIKAVKDTSQKSSDVAISNSKEKLHAKSEESLDDRIVPEQSNASELSLSQKRKKQTESVLAKSQQKKRSMPRERLLEMEEAVKQWNKHFGTRYSVL